MMFTVRLAGRQFLSSSSFSCSSFDRAILTFYWAQLPEVIEDIFRMERNEGNIVPGNLRSLVRIPGAEYRKSQHKEPEGGDFKG